MRPEEGAEIEAEIERYIKKDGRDHWRHGQTRGLLSVILRRHHHVSHFTGGETEPRGALTLEAWAGGEEMEKQSPLVGQSFASSRVRPMP